MKISFGHVDWEYLSKIAFIKNLRTLIPSYSVREAKEVADSIGIDAEIGASSIVYIDDSLITGNVDLFLHQCKSQRINVSVIDLTIPIHSKYKDSLVAIISVALEAEDYAVANDILALLDKYK